MGLVVGQNSYVTVAEADEIIASRFRSTSKERLLWNSLDENDKAVVIIDTTEKYDNDSMLYKYRKAEVNQPLQFPRIMDTGSIVECPEIIKVGLLVQAILDIEAEDSEEKQLVRNGITKYKIKDAEVTFKDTAFNIDKNSVGLNAEVWSRYFSVWSMIS